MKRQIVRLTESELNKIVSESVYTVLKENYEDEGFLGNAWNKVTSAAKGVGNAVMNGGGVKGFQAGYNDSRANYMDDQQGQEDEATANKIKALDNQIAKLQAQKQQLQQQQPGKGQYAQQAQQYRQNANTARTQFRNSWGAAPQQ